MAEKDHVTGDKAAGRAARFCDEAQESATHHSVKHGEVAS